MFRCQKPCIGLTIAFYLFQLFCCSGQVVITEVAVTGVTGVCYNSEYIELSNIGTSQINLSSFVLHNDLGPNHTDAFTLPSNFVLNPGEFRVLCQFQLGSYYFGLKNESVVTLIDSNGTLVTTTGIIPGTGTSSSTYQLISSSDTYMFSSPTPGTVNFAIPTNGVPVISEVAPFGTSNLTLGPCIGGPYIEVFNDAFTTLDLTGFGLRAGESSYTFPNGTVDRYTYFTVCTSSLLAIGWNDNVSISTPDGSVVSSTGPIGGSSPRPSAPDLTWVRVTDYIITSAPFAPFYQYSTSPTPNAINIFPFEPIQLPIQPCGIQVAPLEMLSNYELKETSILDVNSANPELSGGTFDPRTCNHLIIGDDGTLHEVAITNNTPILLRVRPLIGGSRMEMLKTIPDSEGICFYHDPINGDKIAILDERDHSVQICDIPSTSQLVPIFRDSSNCRVAKLTPEQINNASLTNSNDTNVSFEGIACDAVNAKLYIATEADPKIIWSLDFATGVYDVLIDVERLPSWTIEDMNGLAYDPLGKLLYVLSSKSKVIVQSSLNGTILGEAISVGMMEKPGGLTFEPATGDLLIFGEPAILTRFSKRALDGAPTAPVRAPSDDTEEDESPPASLTPVVIDAPVMSPQTTETPVATPTKLPKMVKTKDMKMVGMGKMNSGEVGTKIIGSMKILNMGKKGKNRALAR